MATILHIGLSVEGMRNLLGDTSFLKRSGEQRPGELVELAVQLGNAERGGKRVLSACPTPQIDGSCPGHSA